MWLVATVLDSTDRENISITAENSIIFITAQGTFLNFTDLTAFLSKI